MQRDGTAAALQHICSSPPHIVHALVIVFAVLHESTHTEYIDFVAEVMATVHSCNLVFVHLHCN